jgi:hypothetical protein
MVKDVLRLTKDGVADLLMERAGGWHKLRVRCRHALPTLDWLALCHQT